jgi:hypothetical protein
MPNRILKDSICMSESIDNLSPEAEVLFYRIIVQCDDFGRMDGRLSVIRAKCYPLKIDFIGDEYISNLMHELIQNEMITIYVDGEHYFIQIPSWDKHQQIRAKKSKYPEPTNILSQQQALDIYVFQSLSSDINSNQMLVKSSDINCTRNPIQSNPIDNRNPNTIIETKVSEDSIKLTNKLIDLILRNDPKAKLPKDNNHWNLEMDRLLRIDKRTYDEVDKVISWCQNDSFWKTNILSTAKLRKQFAQLYLKMKNNGHKGVVDGQYSKGNPWANETN